MHSFKKYILRMQFKITWLKMAQWNYIEIQYIAFTQYTDSTTNNNN